MPGAASLAAVAAAAGVSVATASKALNDRPRVSPSTRARVVAAAERLGYVPRQGARRFKLGGTVGIIASDLAGRFALPIMMGAEDAFGLGAISIVMCDARGDAIRERHHLRALVERHVDGIIVLGSISTERASLGSMFDVPLVYAYAPSSAPEDTSVDAGHEQAGTMAAEHLVQAGATKVGIIAGDPRVRATAQRSNAARRHLAAAGVEIVGGVVHTGTYSETWGRTAARAMIGRTPDVDGFLCGNDQIARGVLDVLRDLGWDVPGRARVIGHDNWLDMAESTRPPLTSVDMHLEQLGRLSAGLLLRAIDGDPRPGMHRVEPSLVVRGSTMRTD
ncbi:substrate-binding domain-containing protein [Streptomyces sp. SID8361]|uniref:LacI family DNA-binding transcriptional regulator n=1 Tax=Streptomyces sp. MnatMP-M27 TaxID=1839768 RepID=UPI00081F21D1|nr:LacI family DNA-binding transcriptional regulator [Streptomyces sp. MnatMP-M27]MYU10923.1 substrate-binding domain-containing protein [Streptomyces sp. SID8361]SCF76487.1 transcriptional regulator, LacI family [Streptomyces sp. MnatMP-M27]